MEFFIENNKKYLKLSLINFDKIRKSCLSPYINHLLYDITGRCIGALDKITLCQDLKPYSVITFNYLNNKLEYWDACHLYIIEDDIVKGE